MKHSQYELHKNTDTTIFQFKSIGPNGKITKVIIFSVTKLKIDKKLDGLKIIESKKQEEVSKLTFNLKL